MVAGYLFFTLNTGGFFGIEFDVWPAVIVGLLMTLVLGIAMRVRRVPPAAQRFAAGEARRVARHPAHRAGGDRPHLRHGRAATRPSVLPKDIVQVCDVAHPGRPLLADRHRHRRRGHCSGRCTSTRASAWPRAPPPRARPTRVLAGLSPNRLALMNTILATLVAGFVGILASSLAQLDSNDAAAAGGARARRRALRALHVVRDHVRRRPAHRRRCSRSSTTSRRRAGSRPTRARRCRASARW